MGLHPAEQSNRDRALLSGWGQYPRVKARVLKPADPEEAESLLASYSGLIARGLGRSYGDASLAPVVLDTTRLSRLLEFDPLSGILTAEAGLSLDALLRWSVPRGWFLPVVPGTKFVTLGGAVASDIHGKNHHVDGSFSRHVEELDLLTSPGKWVRCSRQENPRLFEATAGGMGLTGLIGRVRLRLRKIETAFIKKTTYRASDLEAILNLFEAHASDTYSVAWIDCLARGRHLGRSLLFTGEHALWEELPAPLRRQALQPHKNPRLRVPIYFPSATLNPWTVRWFNTFYYHLADKHLRTRFVHYDPFFFPLDSVMDWNRIYGRQGFLQYQFVIPESHGRPVLSKILERISASGLGSFLAVLKLFGHEENSFLGFPFRGYTLALDFPRTPRLEKLLTALDELVIGAGGRIYLTKDARLKNSDFQIQYPQAEAFKSLKKNWDPENRWVSCMSARLGLAGPPELCVPCLQAS
ncbi:MAG: FAD-binding oxidoreductase [Flavobacteriales bacterium]|nr:FAD-binding oxidoreductase [Flavobacteriales bacterium]